MARARNIKPGFWVNADLVELPFSTRLLFIGLWMLADREGRLADRPKQIKMAVFPADEVDVNEALWQLSDAGFIMRYRTPQGLFIQVLAFTKHQNPHRNERASTIPAPGESGASTVQRRPITQPRADQGQTKDGATPADVLNPDSLNPETTTAVDIQPASVDKSSVGVDNSTAVVSRQQVAKVNGHTEVPFLDLLEANGIKVEETQHGILKAWQALKVTDGALLEAVSTAERQREEANSTQPVNIGLLNAILCAPKPKVAAVNWVEVGLRHGILPQPGETAAAFNARVRSSLEGQQPLTH